MTLHDDTHRHLYTEEEMLQLSGLQHYVFCPRQWALIHLEQLWADNILTAEGTLLHQNVDNPYLRETNGSNVVTLRGLRIASPDLGLSGIADAVEIIPFDDAPNQKQTLLKSKLFFALPIEYKRGKPKTTDCDRLQVVAQAIMIEEMFSIHIDKGAIFYWEIRHREYFDITDEMRSMVKKMANEMHAIVKSGILPKAIKKSHCRNCSLIDYCLPSLTGKSAKRYLQDSLKSITFDL